MTDRSANPFRPGFNQPPVELAGRDDVLEDVIDALEVAALDHRTPRPILLSGPRGVGKTVLLSDAADRARAGYGWPRLHVEIKPGRPFTPELVEESQRLTRLVEQSPTGRPFRLTSATLRANLAGVGGEVTLERSPDPAVAAAGLRETLAEFAAALIERESGFVLTVDEAQLSSHDEMVDLAAAAQHATGENWPMVLMLGGLPAMRDGDHSATYFERGSWYELGVLDHADTVQALTEPPRIAGRPMHDDAADLLAQNSGGYPFAIQLYGSYAWRASAGQSTIDLDAAARALPRAARDFERGLYASRWTAATLGQRRYLRAIAELIDAGEAVTGGEVARHLNRTPRQLSRVRSELLTQGTLTRAGEKLRFTTPGMADYVLQRDPTGRV